MNNLRVRHPLALTYKSSEPKMCIVEGSAPYPRWSKAYHTMPKCKVQREKNEFAKFSFMLEYVYVLLLIMVRSS